MQAETPLAAQPELDARPASAVGAVYATHQDARLYLARAGAVEEVLSHGFPVRPNQRPTVADATAAQWRPPALVLAYLWRVDAAVRAALPADVPVIVGGNRALVFRLSSMVAAARPVLGVLTGDEDADDVLHLARRLVGR